MRRMTLELSDEAEERMARLVEQAGAASKSELIRRALTVYATLLEARAEGREIVLRAEGAEDRLVVLT